MTTKLDSELKREVLIDGQPYTLSLSTIGLKLTLKGKRLGIELLWKDLVTGDAALATALQASVIANAHRNLREPLSTASPKALKKSQGLFTETAPVIVHLIDGTYELFRHFYGLRRFNKGRDAEFGAVIGVANTVLKMMEEGATHLGVATDRVIESFRNDLWPGYKTGEGIDAALRHQFRTLEDLLEAMGVMVWPMVELEADDALASAAHRAAKSRSTDKVCIWTPDKDLAQCVVGDRVVQVDRKSGVIRDAEGVKSKFGVVPALIPDYLALVGDAADGYPGIKGLGPKTAALLLNLHGPIEKFPQKVLGESREQALLFKKLATLVSDTPVFKRIDELRWRGATAQFDELATKIDVRLIARVERLVKSRIGS